MGVASQKRKSGKRCREGEQNVLCGDMGCVSMEPVLWDRGLYVQASLRLEYSI